MGSDSKCNKCGGTTFKEGMLGSGHANVKEIGMNLQSGSRVVVTFCLECGEIVSMRVAYPEVFKRSVGAASFEDGDS
ncbi:MAG: hypothetical protein N2376_14955 [Clostridia bacterium]|nr:hypothetical protein [Clostridia bacterium]